MHQRRLAGDSQLHALPRLRLRQRLVQGLVHDFGQIHTGVALQVGAVDHAGVAEQLVEQAAHVRGVALDRLQAAAHVARVVVVQRQLRLRAQCRQRRAHLVRSLGHERAQGLVAARQARHEAVQRRHHLVHFLRRGHRQRLQFRRLAPRQVVLDPVQRAQRAIHPQPDQRQRQQRQQCDRDQRMQHHILRQRFARTPGLPDLHPHLVLRRGRGDPPRYHREAHLLAAVVRIEQPRRRAGARQRRRLRQIAVAGDGAPARIEHAVEHPVFRRHRQQVQRRVRQVHLPLPPGQRHRIDDRQRRGHQQVVVRTVGRALAVVARGEEQRHRAEQREPAQVQQQRAPDRRRRQHGLSHRRRRPAAWLAMYRSRPPPACSRPRAR